MTLFWARSPTKGPGRRPGKARNDQRHWSFPSRIDPALADFVRMDLLARRDQAMKPRAYSYVRFSSPDQEKGDSLRRQVELSEQYAIKHGLDKVQSEL